MEMFVLRLNLYLLSGLNTKMGASSKPTHNRLI